MKRFTFILAIFLCAGFLVSGITQQMQGVLSMKKAAGSPPATPALIASTEKALGQNAGALDAMDTTGANLLVVNVAWYPGITANLTGVDANGHALTPCTAVVDSGQTKNQLWYLQGAFAADASLVITVTANNVYCSAQAMAFSNISSAPLFVEAGTAGGAVNSFQTGACDTTGQAHTVLVAGCSLNATVASIPSSIDSGFASIGGTPTEATAQTGTVQAGAISYKILTSSATENPTWTITGGVFNSVGVIAAFKY